MRDLPQNTDLLDAVAAFLRDELGPELEGRALFQTRVAANVIDTVRRDLAQPAALHEQENRRLAELLEVSGDTHELTHALCDRIAAGDIDFQTPGFADYLWFTTCNKLAVDQPRYAGYRRALAAREAGEDND